LRSVWLRVTVGVGLLLQPVTFAELGVHVQVNNVPVTLEVRDMPVDVLLQICFDKGILERLGTGLTVTTKSVTGPGHEFAVGVI
jgi:hypothetical protein